MSSPEKFRPEINGLRALSVLVVVWFHYDFWPMAGGFVGVDVFFVISGFLMTRIIVAGLDRGQFSLAAFYISRVARIVPPLVFMCFVLLGAGALYVDPVAFKALAREVLTALTFVSDIAYWREAGYFDVRSSAKWLLNTWSLSVEWQFYLIYPVVLMGLYRIQAIRRHLSVLLAVACLASFALEYVVSTLSASAAFYLLPPRAFEMLAGGLVFSLLEREGRTCPYPRIVETLGLVMIGLATLGFDRLTPWPSYRVLLPVVGAALVIAAARKDAAWSRNPVVAAIGRWSYTIYLWHWPLMVFLVYLRIFDAKAKAAIIAGMIAVIAGGTVIERHRGRAVAVRGGRRGGWRRVATPLAASLVALAASSAIVASNGWQTRRPALAQTMRDYQAAMLDWTSPSSCDGMYHGILKPCELGTSGDRTLVLGDSHAQQLYPRFEGYSRAGHRLTYVTARGCPPLPGINMRLSAQPCAIFFDKALALAETEPFQRIVITAMWGGYMPEGDDAAASRNGICFVDGTRCVAEKDAAAFERRMDGVFARLITRLQDLKAKGMDIVVIGATPNSTFDLPRELMRRAFLGIETASLTAGIDRKAFEASNEKAQARLKDLTERVGATFVDPLPSLCGALSCPVLDRDGSLLFVDSNHYRSTAVASSLFDFVDTIFATSAGTGAKVQTDRKASR